MLPMGRSNGGHSMNEFQYRRLTGVHRQAVLPCSVRQFDDTIAILNNPRTKWYDGEEVLRTLPRDGIEHARRTRKLSQGELGKRVGLSRPQMSRIENHPENATLGVLRRISDALSSDSV